MSDQVPDPMPASEAIKPIVFSIPDFTPNTRLTVFDQEFHCHSPFLKLHSASFANSSIRRKRVSRRLRQASDTNGLRRSMRMVLGPLFGLALGKRKILIDHRATTWDADRDTPEEVKAFNIVLKAIHYGSVKFQNASLLCLATKHADYYCALQSLSNACYLGFDNSKFFRWDIFNNAIDLLAASVKLRNEKLYKECMISLMGPWDSPHYLKIEDDKLKQLAASAHHKLCLQVLEVQKELAWCILTVEPAFTEKYQALEARAIEKWSGIDSEGRPTVPSLPKT